MDELYNDYHILVLVVESASKHDLKDDMHGARCTLWANGPNKKRLANFILAPEEPPPSVDTNVTLTAFVKEQVENMTKKDETMFFFAGGLYRVNSGEETDWNFVSWAKPCTRNYRYQARQMLEDFPLRNPKGLPKPNEEELLACEMPEVTARA